MRTSARKRAKREVLVLLGAMDMRVGWESQERWRRFAMRGRDVRGRVDSCECISINWGDKKNTDQLRTDEHLQIMWMISFRGGAYALYSGGLRCNQPWEIQWCASLVTVEVETRCSREWPRSSQRPSKSQKLSGYVKLYVFAWRLTCNVRLVNDVLFAPIHFGSMSTTFQVAWSNVRLCNPPIIISFSDWSVVSFAWMLKCWSRDLFWKESRNEGRMGQTQVNEERFPQSRRASEQSRRNWGCGSHKGDFSSGTARMSRSGSQSRK